jgi:hypothetical protein
MNTNQDYINYYVFPKLSNDIINHILPFLNIYEQAYLLVSSKPKKKFIFINQHSQGSRIEYSIGWKNNNSGFGESIHKEKILLWNNRIFYFNHKYSMLLCEKILFKTLLILIYKYKHTFSNYYSYSQEKLMKILIGYI